MLSELSSGEYRYPDLKFMVRIHHVTEGRIDGVGKGERGKYLERTCSIFISARIHSNLITCYLLVYRPNNSRLYHLKRLMIRIDIRSFIKRKLK